MQQIIFLLCLFATTLLQGSDAFTVSLDTEVPLEPIYVAGIESESSSYDQKYLQELYSILAYDLNHNGMTAVMTRTGERLALENSEKGRESFSRAAWREQKALYVVKGRAEGKKLIVSLYFVQDNKGKKIEPQSLTGNLAHDRKTVHQIADWIFKNLYNKPGVCSSTILYTAREKNRDPSFKSEYLSEVWQCDFDGKNAEQITHEGRYIVTPCYIPAKKGFRPGSFLFVSYRIGQPKIYVGSLQDGSSHQLLTLRGNQFMPAISSDKSQIAFICDAMGNPDLFVLPYDDDVGSGKPRQIFASPRGTQGSPSFSPDSKKIVFVSNKDGNPRIYLMEVPGPSVLLKEMKPRLISRTCRENTSPSWSPDGTKIVYAGMTSGTRQIWVYDLEKETEEQVTFDKSNKENPTWASDSFHIVFNAEAAGGKAQLATCNLNQRQTFFLTEGGLDKRFPCVEPLVK